MLKSPSKLLNLVL